MSWLRQLVSRRRLYRELSEEIQAHLDEKVEELVEGGMSPKEAKYAARREFGNVGLVEEKSRDVWGSPLVEDFLSDIRSGLRTLRHNPVFTVVAMLAISIGIAANAAVFSVVNSVLLKPLHYPQAEELVALHQTALGAEGLADFENGLLLSPSMYFTYAEHNRTFQSLGVWTTGTNGLGSNPHIYETWKITPMIRPLKQEVIDNVGELLWVVMGTIGVVMLISCQRDKSVAGAGRSASAGIGCSCGARRGLGVNCPRTSRRTRNAWSDGWVGGHWFSVRRCALSRGNGPVKSAASH